jgi:hypothetical protein
LTDLAEWQEMSKDELLDEIWEADEAIKAAKAASNRSRKHTVAHSHVVAAVAKVDAMDAVRDEGEAETRELEAATAEAGAGALAVVKKHDEDGVAGRQHTGSSVVSAIFTGEVGLPSTQAGAGVLEDSGEDNFDLPSPRSRTRPVTVQDHADFGDLDRILTTACLLHDKVHAQRLHATQVCPATLGHLANLLIPSSCFAQMEFMVGRLFCEAKELVAVLREEQQRQQEQRPQVDDRLRVPHPPKQAPQAQPSRPHQQKQQRPPAAPPSKLETGPVRAFTGRCRSAIGLHIA